MCLTLSYVLPMKVSPLPENEKERLEILRSYQILDSAAEPDFDSIVDLASEICETPIAIITLVDDNRQWFKAKVGLNESETSRDVSFCAHAIHDEKILVVPDTLKDKRFHDNPFVTDNPKIRFYAGMPLTTSSGHKLGTLCVIDKKPRKLTKTQLKDLRILGKQVINLLDLRLRNLELKGKLAQQAIAIQGAEERNTLIMDSSIDAIVCMNKLGAITFWNPVAEKIFGWSEPEVIGKPMADTIIPEQYRQLHKNGLAYYQKTGEGPVLSKLIEISALNKNGIEFPIELTIVHIKKESDGFFCAFIRDISERKKAEMRLRENRENLERAEQQSGLGSWYYDVTSGKRYWSKQMFHLFGLDPQGEIPTDDETLLRYHPDDRNLLKETVSKIIQGELTEPINIRTNPEWPPLRYLKPTLNIVRDGSGKPVRLEGTLQDITGLKKAETALQQSEANYRSIFENALIGIYQSTPGGRFITANPTMAQMFGYNSPAELISSISNIGSQIYADKTERHHLKDLLKKQGQAMGYEFRVLKKNGEIIWVRDNVRTVYEPDGRVKYYEGSLKDITEQKAFEGKLIKEKQLSDSIINSLPGVLYLYDSTGKFIRWNKNFETVTGYSGQEIANMHPLQLFDEDEKELLTNRISGVFNTGFGEVEAHFLQKDKKKILYYFNGWRIEYEGKTCLIGVGIDISVRKKAEAKSIASENKLRAFFRSTPDSSVLLGRNFEVLALNEAANQLNFNTYGSELHEGDIFLDRIFPEVRPLIQEFVEKAFLGENSQGEFPIPNMETGKSVWWLAVFMPAYDNDGNIFAVVANSTNIDKIKRAEFQIKRQLEELQKTNHELDHFVYSVSHDLRSPLASILGLLNVAEMENPNPAFGNYFTMIRSSAIQMDGFIKDILDYSRNARMELHAEKIDFETLFVETQENFRMIKGADRIKIETQIPIDFEFYSDKARLGIILNNLMSNAIKYQDYHKPISQVNISVRQAYQGVLLKFQDNGIGVEPKHLDKIFNMFYRASENSKGSGLGLYIAQQTVTKLGGTISVKSVFGEFTEFEIVIPRL